MSGVWAIVPNESSFGTVQGTVAMQLNRCVAATERTNLGGGLMRFTADDQLGPWTLSYDEVFYVLSGQLSIESDDGDVMLRTGEIGLIESGTTVTYRGTEGTKAFYSVTPREWKPAGAPLEMDYGQ